MIDLLLGGSPCQGFSFAGKQLNFFDPRSKLFFDFVKALEALKPKYFLLENVKMKKEYEDIITQHLGVKPIEINSALVSALIHSEKALEYMDRTVKDGRTHWDFMHHSDIRNPKSSAVVANFFKGVPYNVFKDWDCIRKFHPIECERLQTLPDGYTDGLSDTQRYKCIGNGWTVDVIAHILSFIPETYLHTVVSLFDGISCGQVALERAGKIYNQYYASEIDKYAIAVTQKNYPHTMQLGDVTQIDWAVFLDRLNIIQKVSYKVMKGVVG